MERERFSIYFYFLIQAIEHSAKIAAEKAKQAKAMIAQQVLDSRTDRQITHIHTHTHTHTERERVTTRKRK